MSSEEGRIAHELCERINSDPVFNKWNKIAAAFGLNFNLKATPKINLDGSPIRDEKEIPNTTNVVG